MRALAKCCWPKVVSYTLIQSPTSIALAHENPTLHLVVKFWKNQFFRKRDIFGHKQFIARKVIFCRGARVCARQMLLTQSSFIYIDSIPHIDCPSVREPYLVFGGKLLKKSIFFENEPFWSISNLLREKWYSVGARACALANCCWPKISLNIDSIPYIDCPSARELYLAFGGKLLKKSIFSKTRHFWA